MTIRVYGMLSDYGSYAQVTRGFVEGFRGHGYTDQTLDVKSMEEEGSFDEVPTGLPFAHAGIVTGPPIGSSCLLRGVRHQKRFVMVAPNSTKLPERTMAIVSASATHLLVPSEWAADVVARYTHHPVVVVPHGVSQEFFVPEQATAELEKAYSAGIFRVLHFSSTGGQRKGTVELFRAFALALKRGYLPPQSRLGLVLSPQAKGALLEEMMGVDEAVPHVTIFDRLNGVGFPPREMAKFFNCSHVVCQPSRGEGFGLVPLEALACGVPVAATTCTGHGQWFRVGLDASAIAIPSQELRPIDDMPGAEAPHVRVSDIVDALSRSYLEWRERRAAAVAGAAALRERFSWKNQIVEFLSLAKEEGSDGIS